MLNLREYENIMRLKRNGRSWTDYSINSNNSNKFKIRQIGNQFSSLQMSQPFLIYISCKIQNYINGN